MTNNSTAQATDHSHRWRYQAILGLTSRKRICKRCGRTEIIVKKQGKFMRS